MAGSLPHDDPGHKRKSRITGLTPRSFFQTPVRFREITPALEFCAWVMVALAPSLRLVNGPPVTTDQWVLQVAVAALSVLAAASLRIYNWRTPMPPPFDQDNPTPND